MRASPGRTTGGSSSSTTAGRSPGATCHPPSYTSSRSSPPERRGRPSVSSASSDASIPRASISTSSRGSRSCPPAAPSRPRGASPAPPASRTWKWTRPRRASPGSSGSRSAGRCKTAFLDAVSSWTRVAPDREREREGERERAEKEGGKTPGGTRVLSVTFLTLLSCFPSLPAFLILPFPRSPSGGRPSEGEIMNTPRRRLSMEWRLRNAAGDDLPFHLHPGDSISVGRDLSADIPVLHAGVSRHHALLELDGNDLWLEDLHSQGGTTVNGEPIRRTRVEAGDVLTFGGASFTLTSRPPLDGETDPCRKLSRERLLSLLRLSREIGTGGERGLLFRTIVQAAVEDLCAERGIILLRDPERPAFLAAAAHPSSLLASALRILPP